LVISGKRGRKYRQPIGYHWIKLFDKQLEFFLPIVLRKLRQGSPCIIFPSGFAGNSCECCLPACLLAGRVPGTDVAVMRSPWGDAQHNFGFTVGREGTPELPLLVDLLFVVGILPVRICASKYSGS